MLLRFVLIAVIYCFALPTFAQSAVDLYEFDTAAQEQRYFELSEVLRCPKCQNQNLAGSNSQIAEDLRRELHRLLLDGMTDQEIKDHMVERYGDFVLYKPPIKASTVILWALPVALLVIGFIGISSVVRTRRRKAQERLALSPEEQDKLNDMLKP